MDHKREMVSMGMVMVLTMVFAYFIGLQEGFGVHGVGNVMVYSLGNALTLTALCYPYWSEGKLKNPDLFFSFGVFLLSLMAVYVMYLLTVATKSPFPAHWNLNQGALAYISYVTVGLTMMLIAVVSDHSKNQ